MRSETGDRDKPGQDVDMSSGFKQIDTTKNAATTLIDMYEQ